MPTAPARAALLGFATGLRSASGLTALVLTTPQQPGSPQTLGVLTAKRARPGVLAFWAGELVADKLPSTPSRTIPPAFAARVLNGALCGLLVAQRSRSSAGLPVVLGAVGAAVGTVAGAQARAKLLPATVPGALVEDVAAAGLAWAASR